MVNIMDELHRQWEGFRFLPRATGCNDPKIDDAETACEDKAYGSCSTAVSSNPCACQTWPAFSSKLSVCAMQANSQYGSYCWTPVSSNFCDQYSTISSSKPSSSTVPNSTPVTTTTTSKTTPPTTTKTTTPSPTVVTVSETTTSTSSSTSTRTTEKSTPTTTTPVPTVVYVAPSTVTASLTSSSTSSTHAPVPKWSGSGSLLQGYCATPEFTTIDGPTVTLAPIVGCVGDKPDCCPFTVTSTATATAVVGTTVTVDAGSGQIASQAWPAPQAPAQATLGTCPDDYSAVADGCCPSGYLLWNAALGGQTPCYSTLQNPLTPPPIVALGSGTGATGAFGSAASPKSTSAIVNVVYAMHYPTPTHASMPTATKVGIGAGTGAAALAIGALVGLLVWRTKKHNKTKRDLQRERDSTMAYSRGTSIANTAQLTNDNAVDSWRRSMPPPGPISPPVQPPMGQQQAFYPPPANPQQQYRAYEQQPLMNAQTPSSDPSSPPHSGRYYSGVSGQPSFNSSPSPVQQPSELAVVNTSGNISPVQGSFAQNQGEYAPVPRQSVTSQNMQPQELQDDSWAGRYELPVQGPMSPAPGPQAPPPGPVPYRQY